LRYWKLSYRLKFLQIIKVIAYCTPVIIGAVSIATTRLFRTGDIILVETAADNFFVNLFRIGVSFGVIGTLLLPTGMLLGI
jgi:hypothetical protein